MNRGRASDFRIQTPSIMAWRGQTTESRCEGIGPLLCASMRVPGDHPEDSALVLIVAASLGREH